MHVEASLPDLDYADSVTLRLCGATYEVSHLVELLAHPAMSVSHVACMLHVIRKCMHTQMHTFTATEGQDTAQFVAVSSSHFKTTLLFLDMCESF